MVWPMGQIWSSIVFTKFYWNKIPSGDMLSITTFSTRKSPLRSCDRVNTYPEKLKILITGSLKMLAKPKV